jgi:glycosyltransferase involved in cell wall biosynthesis
MSSVGATLDGKLRRPCVLIVANTGWYLRNFRARLVERLEAAGYEVILAAPPDGETQEAFFQNRPFMALRVSRKGRDPLAELWAVGRFIKLFRSVRPDVVLTWTPKPNLYGAAAGRLLGTPVIPNVSGLGMVFIKGGIMARLVGGLYRHAFARAPKVFFQNDEDQKAFVSAGWLEAKKAERLPGSGVDLQRFAARPLPSPDPFVFLYVGRLLADKGLRELVEAAINLRRSGRNFVIRLAGFVDAGNPAGIAQEELDSWIAAGDIEYLGSLRDVRPAVAEAHCVVLPSYYREGVPRSLLEAAAMGRPIITTDAPGCRDTVVRGKSGLLCEPRSAASLADCMTRMLGLSPEALTEMGRAGRAHVEQHFSEEIVLDAYLRECAAVVGRRHPGHDAVAAE